MSKIIYMKIYSIHREQNLPITIDEAWIFFSSAKNLGKITPPEMGFKIISKLKEEPIYSGMKIEYIIKPKFGIPLKWVTEIKNVHGPYSFADRQHKGPYKLWEHIHSFQSIAGGVKMNDDVKYCLPLGWLGLVAHWLFVRKEVEQIFDFRALALNKLFGQLNKGSYVAV